MMRKIYLILLIALMAVPAAVAQKKERKSQQEMFKELQDFKLKFMAQEIDLQDDQKERFAKLYGEMQEKREEVMRSAWEAERKVRKGKDATEADYKAAAEAMSRAKEKDAQIEREYDRKFSEFLTSKQLFKLKTAENKFRMKMDEMRHKHSKSPGKGAKHKSQPAD